MAVEIAIPQVGESITEAQIGQWRAAVGDWVAKDSILVEIETDKATTELPAPVSGILVAILKETGDDAEIGEVIARMEPGEQVDRPAPTAAPAAAPAPEAELVMPAARRLLAEHGLSAGEVAATGPGGRLTKEDVLRHLAAPTEPVPAPVAAVPTPPPLPTAEGERPEEAVRMSPLRRKVAQRLVEAQQTAALLTTFNEVDMSAVMALRQQYQEAFTKKYDIKLGFLSFFVKALIEALKQFPALNAEIRGDQIIYRDYYDIGIAVSTDKGLVVPAIRDAQSLSFAEVELAVADLARRGRTNQLAVEELTGGTFTITNGGIFGSLLSTPIVNPPQSGILGLHAIVDRPVARGGEVVIRPMMYLALTYDHRIVDGREAVTCLVRIKERIEDPTRILLEV